MRRLTAALLVVLVLGCSSGVDESAPPPPSAFTEGACRTVAPAVLDVGRTARALGRKAPADDVLRTLADAQQALRAQPRFPELSVQVDQLLSDVGFVRLRTASGSYAADLRDGVIVSYDALVATCTGAG